MAAKYPDQRTLFASWNRQQDIRLLSNLLIGKPAQLRPGSRVLYLTCVSTLPDQISPS